MFPKGLLMWLKIQMPEEKPLPLPGKCLELAFMKR